MSVTIEDVRRAAGTIAGGIARTPLVHSRTLSDIIGASVSLKIESLQYTASFKERGALNKLLSLTAQERHAGVIAMSAGNHAQAVAHHARRLGIAATIVMPRNTPFIKINNTELLGAHIVLEGETLAEAARHAHAIADAERRTFVHPYDDPMVVAGQGTIALEMLEDEPGLDTLIVPVGGGGLIAGVAVATKAVNPEIEIIGVQAALAPAMRRALDGLATETLGPTIAEGIAVRLPGQVTLPIIRSLVAEIVLVEEPAIERAITLIAEIEKLVAEGAGAAALAAVLANPGRFAGRKLGLVVSGGNIDSRLLALVLMRGLARSGRLVRLRVEVSDAPGQLARVTARIAESGGNIIEVQHERRFAQGPVRLTEVSLLIETRNADAAARIQADVTAAGFAARLLDL